MSTNHIPFYFFPLAFAALLIIIPGVTTAQSPGTVTGRVTDDEGPAPGVNVVLNGTTYGAATDARGVFRIPSASPGDYTLAAHFVGYRTEQHTIQVVAGDTTHIRLTLRPASIQMSGIEVTALRPDLQRTTRYDAAALRESNPRDSGELVREVGGVDAVRRGPVGLDPVVRGLRETQVGMYIDGTRSFASCAGRMDSPLAHIDPSAVQSIEVVKGPYALTWGAGNLSAIRVETPSLDAIAERTIKGRLTSGYDANYGAF
jgi:iron complex outermembrane receptor protein